MTSTRPLRLNVLALLVLLLLAVPALAGHAGTSTSHDLQPTAALAALPSDFNGDGVEDRAIGVPADGGGEPMIHVDLDDPRIGAEGAPVFKPHGGNAPYLDAIAGVLQTLFVGMAAGAYSSIFIATPLLVQMKSSESEVKLAEKRAKARAKKESADRYASVPTGTRDDDLPGIAPSDAGLPPADADERPAEPTSVPSFGSAPTPTGRGRTATGPRPTSCWPRPPRRCSSWCRSKRCGSTPSTCRPTSAGCSTS